MFVEELISFKLSIIFLGPFRCMVYFPKNLFHNSWVSEKVFSEFSLLFKGYCPTYKTSPESKIKRIGNERSNLPSPRPHNKQPSLGDIEL